MKFVSSFEVILESTMLSACNKPHESILPLLLSCLVTTIKSCLFFFNTPLLS